MLVSCVTSYYLAPGLWTKGDMKRLDDRIRGHLRKTKHKDRAASANRLYLARKAGGKGICRLEDIYCQTILSLESYLSEAEDEFVQLHLH